MVFMDGLKFKNIKSYKLFMAFDSYKYFGMAGAFLLVDSNLCKLEFLQEEQLDLTG